MIANCYSERRLAAAILKQAIRDASSGNGHSIEARRWLESDYARNLFDALGIHFEIAKKWMETLAPPPQPALPGMFE